MGKCVVKFKDTSSVSNNEVEIQYRIPMTVRQQQYWRLACRKKYGQVLLRKLGCQNAAFNEN